MVATNLPTSGILPSRTTKFGVGRAMAPMAAKYLKRTPFGTRGSQVQILPLRPAFSMHERLDVRPGVWLISPYTGWKWAKWPSGDVGWLSADTQLPAILQVAALNDMQ